jgi:hypothetical protein
MRGTGAELRVVAMKVLYWRWSEDATLSSFIEGSTVIREEPVGKAKPFVRGHRRSARHWVQDVRRREPALFAHWRLLYRTTAGQ